LGEIVDYLTCPECGSRNVKLVKPNLIPPVFYYKCLDCGYEWRMVNKGLLIAELAVSGFVGLPLAAYASGKVLPPI